MGFLKAKACKKVRVCMVHTCLAAQSQQVNLAFGSAQCPKNFFFLSNPFI